MYICYTLTYTYMCAYEQICIHMCLCIYIYIYIYMSLSLYIYIYIYAYICRPLLRALRRPPWDVGFLPAEPARPRR